MELREALIEAALKAGMFSNLKDKRRHAADRVEWTFDEYPALEGLTLREFTGDDLDTDLFIDALEMFTQRDVTSDQFQKVEVALDRLSLDHRGQEVPAKSNGGKPAGDNWVSPGRIVCSWPDLDLTARAVMFVMAAHGNNKGEGIWISQERIAAYLGFQSTEPIRRAWRRLEEEGAITKTAEARQHKPPTWKLNKGRGVV